MTGPDGNPAISLIGGSEPGVILSLNNKPRVGLSASSEGAKFEVVNPNGITTAALGDYEFGGALSISPANSKSPRVIATCDAIGPQLRLLGPQGDPRATMFVTNSGDKAAMLLSDGGDANVSMILVKDGGFVTASHPTSGTAQIGYSHDWTLPRFMVFDGDKNIAINSATWAAPQR